ncbi:MAG: hypothetical protein NVSMB58_37810 [Terriglobales bacterium]
MPVYPDAPSFTSLAKWKSVQSHELGARPYFSLLFISAVLLALTAAWLPLLPARLYDFDAANFALALEHFNPALHQPQPPGYPLFVALAKTVHTVVPSVRIVFFLSGLMGATAATFLLFRLGAKMFGFKAGLLAALLFMTNPVLWSAGLSSPVRVYIAVIAVATTLAVWPGWSGRISPRRFNEACLLLGFLSGFRPEMIVLMSPLVVVTGVWSRLRLGHYLLGMTCFWAGIATWMPLMILKVGGAAMYVQLLREYTAQQTSNSSVLYGANSKAALGMLKNALAWTGLGVVAWLPAATLVRHRDVFPQSRRVFFFFLLWFVPAFLFSIFVHIGAPGHALSTIPIFCLIGGWVLSVGEERVNQHSWVGGVTAVLAFNVILFFHPFSKATRESSYKPIRLLGDITATTLDRIDQLKAKHPIFLISCGAPVAWRILMYYYPDVPLLFLPSYPDIDGASTEPWRAQNKQVTEAKTANLSVPSCGKIVWVFQEPRLKALVMRTVDAEDLGTLLITEARPAMRFQLGKYEFVFSSKACSGAPYDPS